MTSLLSAEARKQVTEALEAAINGIAWYRATFTDADSPADDEAEQQLGAALALLASLPEAPTDDQRFTELSAQLATEIARNAEVARLLLAPDREGSVKWARGLSLRQTGVEPRVVVEADAQVQGEVSDARRLDWLDSDDCQSFTKVSKLWHSRSRVASFANFEHARGVIDAALAAQEKAKGQP